MIRKGFFEQGKLQASRVKGRRRVFYEEFNEGLRHDLLHKQHSQSNCGFYFIRRRLGLARLPLPHGHHFTPIALWVREIIGDMVGLFTRAEYGVCVSEYVFFCRTRMKRKSKQRTREGGLISRPLLVKQRLTLFAPFVRDYRSCCRPWAM